ncbi:hypothetical protein LX36DRAFT_287412 [Colletotrichum falcatum]|nr:hypothetical protein LX36DRAFT_287412 [Colletotrichum falcatum]
MCGGEGESDSAKRPCGRMRRDCPRGGKRKLPRGFHLLPEDRTKTTPNDAPPPSPRFSQRKPITLTRHFPPPSSRFERRAGCQSFDVANVSGSGWMSVDRPSEIRPPPHILVVLSVSGGRVGQ